MRKRKRRKLSAPALKFAAVLTVATVITVGAIGILARSGEPKANKRTGHGVRLESAAPLVPPEMLDAAKWRYIIEQSIRNDTIAKIDAYLQRKGSPMAGTGRKWLECSERYGIPYSLAIGIMGWESAFARQCFRPYNAGGLMQYAGFGCWEEYIEAQYGFLAEHFGHPQVAENCPGYCELTPQSWLNGVNGIRREVEAL